MADPLFGGSLRFDISGDREFVGEAGLQPANKSQPNVFPAARATELAGPILAGNTSFTSVKLSTKSFDTQAAELMAGALRQLEVRARPRIGPPAGFRRWRWPTSPTASPGGSRRWRSRCGRPEAGGTGRQALATLCNAFENKPLRQVDLSDNALGEKAGGPGGLGLIPGAQGVRACLPVLSSLESLESLTLSNNGISHECAKLVADLLMPEGAPSRLTRFHFCNNMSGEEGGREIARILAGAPQLTDFKMQSTRCSGSGSLAIAAAAGQAVNLCKLDLCDNMFGAAGGAQLAASLPSLPQLAELHLKDIGLADEGGRVLLEAIAGCAPLLQVLSLGCNELTGGVTGLIVEATSGKERLRELLLEENELGDEAVRSVGSAVAHRSKYLQLQVLDLGSNQVHSAAAEHLALCLADKDEMRQLGLDGNEIGLAAVARIESLCAEANISFSCEDNEPPEVEDETPDAAPASKPAVDPPVPASGGSDSVTAAASKGVLVKVTTEHTWSEAGPLGLKLLQKGQHKEDKYGVKVSGVTRDYVPQHLVGLNLEALNGEQVDNITHAEVMTKLKAAGRPLTLRFNGTMAADAAAQAGLLSDDSKRIDMTPPLAPAAAPKPAGSSAANTTAPLVANLGAPTAEEAAAKLAANQPKAVLVKVTTEHTWSEAGPLGLKLLQKGQHKEDKYGVKVSGVTRDYVPQHLVGLNLEALNGEQVDNITHAEVMTKLKAAGRPLTLRFNGTMAADAAAQAGLLSDDSKRIDMTPPLAPAAAPKPANTTAPLVANLGAPTAEEAAAKLAANQPKAVLVKVTTEHTWSEAGPLGLKLLQKGQHKEDKYGVKVSGVTRDYVPQHLVGLNLEALNGEQVDNITHAEVMTKLKAAGRPLTLRFNGTMAADLAEQAGLISPVAIAAAPAGSSPVVAPLPPPQTDVPTFNFSGASSSTAAPFSFGGASSGAAPTFDFGSTAPAAAPSSSGFQFNFQTTTTPGAPAFNFGSAAADTTDSASAAAPFQFKFTPSAGGAAPGADDDDDDDDEDEEGDEDFEEFDFDEDDEDDSWLFASEEVDADELREGFGCDQAVVVKLNCNKTQSLDDVTKVLQTQAKKCMKELELTRSDEAAAEGSGPEHAKKVIRALVGSDGLVVAFKTLPPKKKLAIGAVAQLLQCVGAVVDELAPEEEDEDEEDEEDGPPLLVAVLEGWQEESIEGPSIENPDETVELEVSPLEEDDDGWVYSCDPETGIAEMKAGLGVEDDQLQIVELDATGWTGLKPVAAALKEATGKGQALKQGKGVTKLLQKNLTQLCREGLVLRIIVDQGDEKAVNAVCQLLQCIFTVTMEMDENEEEYGCVAAFLPGWQGTVIQGQAIEDQQEMVELPVIPFDDDQAETMTMEELQAALGPEGVEALMGKLQGLELAEPSKSKGGKKKKK